jgi:hypothetical protein
MFHRWTFFGALCFAVCGFATSADAQSPPVVVAAERAPTESPQASLERYRSDLAAFRKEFGGSHDMPDIPFFQFGMGLRTKYLFKNGVLRNALDGSEVRRWDAKQCWIVPPDYLVSLITTDGRTVEIREDEKGVWVTEAGKKTALDGTEKPLHLPDFSGRRYASVLRVLHQEILMNVTDHGPVPNFYVYKKPWYRDGCMMAMCLKATGNLDLIRDWILGLSDPYDRNAGLPEADNPGQALFLISLVSDKNHPLVPKIQLALSKTEVQRDGGPFIKGKTDFSEHPVYETKWTKFGLHALGLNDPYTIPHQADSYSSLFWMDYRDSYVPGKDADGHGLYPYLNWAIDHFQRKKRSPISNRDYPLTWETKATQADYQGMAIVDAEFVNQKTAVPHTWHASEIFLYLMDSEAR